MTSNVDGGIDRVIDKIKALGLQSNTYIFSCLTAEADSACPVNRGPAPPL